MIWSVQKDAHGFWVIKDDQPYLTPASKPLLLPTQSLAEVVRGELEKLDIRKPNPALLPMTRLAATALDLVAPNREDIIRKLASYGESDLLCYRSGESDPLFQKEEQIWQPYLSWYLETFGVPLLSRSGIAPLTQSEDALRVLEAHLAKFDIYHLVGVRDVADITGSIVLALALVHNHATVDAIVEAALLEERHQSEKWGRDEDKDKRQEDIRHDLAELETWFNLLKA